MSATSEAQTVRDDFDVANAGVVASLVEGNTLYIAGAFTRVGPRTGGGVPISPTTGAPVAGFPKVEGAVLAVEPDGAGGWYIGGRFASVGGIPRNNIAHILSDNTVSSWNPDITGEPSLTGTPGVFHLALVGTTVYAGGLFTSAGGQPRQGFVALDASTGAATGLNLNGAGFVAARGTTIYASGTFQGSGGPVTGLAALDATTGNLMWVTDLEYGSNPKVAGFINSIAFSGSTAFLGGLFTSVAGAPRRYLAAVDITTGIPTAWNPDADAEVRAIVVDGANVYVGGDFGRIGGQYRSGVAALDATTALVESLDPEAIGKVWSLALGGGTLYIGGDFPLVGGQLRNNLAAVDVSSGNVISWDPHVGGGVQQRVRALATDGAEVYVGGEFGIVGGEPRNYLAAIDLKTGHVTGWNPDPDAPVRVLAAEGGVVYVAGDFSNIGSKPRSGLAAVDMRTGEVTPWDPSPSAGDFGGPGVEALAIEGSTVYVGGTFGAIGGGTHTDIAAVDRITGRATSWQPTLAGPPLFILSVNSIATGNGLVFVGGQGFIDAVDAGTGAKVWGHDWPNENVSGAAFTLSHGLLYLIDNGSPEALDVATGAPTTWKPGVQVFAEALAVRGNVVYVGSQFDVDPTKNLMAVDARTGSVLDWGPRPNDGVATLAFSGQSVVVGGAFGLMGATSRFAGTSSRPCLAVISTAKDSPGGNPAAAILPTTVIESSASVSPNPMNPSGVLRFRTVAPGGVSIHLFDISGRLVRTIVESKRFDAGNHAVVIDGRDDRGAALPTGVYLYRVDTPQGVLSGRFTILK